jgi:translocation and assembly module TamB
MLRRVGRVLLGAGLALAVAGVALAAVVLATAPGHERLRRMAVSALARSVDGTVRVDEVGGPLWRAADVRGITLATPDGQAVIRAERVRVTFAVTDLVRRRFRFSSVTLVRPEIVLEQDTAGVWNIARLFRRTEPRPPGGPPPLVDLREVSLADGTVIVRQHRRGGVVTERRFSGVSAELSRVRASHPDTSGIEAVIRSLRGRATNPDLEIRALRGVVLLDGDSLRFALPSAALAETRLTGAGLVRWGRAHLVVEAGVTASRLAFADLRALVSRLPESGGGRLTARIRLPGDGSWDVTLRDAALSTGRSSVAGALRVVRGTRGGVVLRDVDLQLRPLDLAAIAPWVDALPIHGLLAGRVRGGGTLRDLAVDGTLAWTDEAAPGAPVNELDARGRLAVGGPDQVTFLGLVLRRAEFGFATIARYVPGGDLPGRLRAEGRLDGAWRRAEFMGRLHHLGASGLTTAARGRVAMVIGDSVRLDVDLDVDSLSLGLLRQRWPQVPAGPVLAGKVGVHGYTTALGIAATLKGAGGAISATGTVGSRGDAMHVALAGTFDGLDLAPWRHGLPPSALWGLWSADLRVPTGDSAALTTGRVRASLRPSRVTGLGMRSGAVSFALTDDRIEVDSLRVETAAGPLSASGVLGRRPGVASSFTFAARVDTLGYAEPLLRWVATTRGDSGTVGLDGAGLVRGRVTGTAPQWRIDGAVAVGAVQYGALRLRAAEVSGQVVGGAGPLRVALTAAADTAGWAGFTYAPMGADAAGRTDSLTATVRAAFGDGSAAVVTAAWLADSVTRRLRVDALNLDLPVQRWHIAHPVTVAFDGAAITVDSLVMLPERGAGRLLAHGALPRSGVGDLTVRADSIPLVDVQALLGRDTAGVGGAVDVAARLYGSAGDPVIEVAAAVQEARFGEYRAPLTQVLARYGDRLLTLKGGMWRGEARVLTLRGAVPLDLALAPVARRRLPGPLALSAEADSVDLTVLDPMIDVVEGMSGVLRGNVRVAGTWDDLTLGGYAEIAGGTVAVPALGARYTGLDVRLDLADDLITLTRGTARSGGTVEIGGTIRMVQGGQLDLTIQARGFEAFDIREFGGLTGTGDLTLRGPLLGAALAGRLRVDRGYLKFADLVEKNIVSLDDPEFRAVVDSTLALASDLRPEFRTVFVDSLRIPGLTLQMGPDVWLRSSEANIQLDGDFSVVKTIEDRLPRYRLDGTLRALRGTYRLVLGPTNSPFQVAKDFRVSRGTVRFYGTPDFNPEMDVVAEHQMRTTDGQPLTVRALIGGTLLLPRLRLESDFQPTLNETEIVSYLLFGRPPNELAGGTNGGTGGEIGILQSTVSGLAGEFGQSLISDLGLPLSYLTIQPGAAQPNDALGLSTARIGAGIQVGDRTFLTLTAGLCEVVTSQLIGASVEYQVSRPWSVSAAFEPMVRECGMSSRLTGLTSRYQLSFDLTWQQGGR